MTISVLHPSRSRPVKSLQTILKCVEALDTEIIISLDADDPDLKHYPRHGEEDWLTVIVNKNRSAVDAINNAAKVSKGELLIVVSDDTDIPKGWVLKLENEIGDRKDFVMKTQDGTQPWIITMPIMDRAYYNRFGYIYHPGYQHMFCDTELTCVADMTGRKLTSNILFKHNHYSVTKEAPDAISKKADGTWDQGEKLFLERYKRNFDLPADQIKGKIQDNGMINWLKRKVR